MSLYGGIKFAIGGKEETDDNAKPAFSNVASPSKPPQTTNGKSNSLTEALTTSIPAPEAEKPKNAGEWSAALKFAPRIPKPKPAPGRPTAPTVPSASGLDSPSTSQGTSSSLTGATMKPDIVRFAEPQLFTNRAAADEIVVGPDGKPLARAPSMTLAPKGKGAKGKMQARNDGTSAMEGKKRKKKKKKQRQPLMPTFDPDEQYDPNKPNDLGEYQWYRKQVKEERRARLLEEKQRRAAGESSEGSSYYTDSEEEAAPRRDAPKMFAPPRQYSPPSSSFRPPSPPPEEAPPRPPPPAESGDDAYARRAAMSQAATGDDAYARRAVMAPAATGDDAYARRSAMSQAAQGVPPPPSLLPAPAPPPNFGLSAVPIPTAAATTTAGSGSTDEFNQMLEERKKAAQAIAAKLQAFAGSAPPPPQVAPAPPPDEDQSGTFAEKMMRRWGHKEGSGIGARGEGIVHALSAEHVVAPPKPADPNQPLSKRQLAKQKAAAANAKKRKWVQAPNARGRIVNANEDEGMKDEKGGSGEASRVICLVGLVGSVDEVDEELSDEIGEECSNYGIVERVVLHMVEPPPEEPAECLRIFIVFSGMAGAWRATKELDGRFFGGRKIAAFYYDEGCFNAGERDGTLR